MIFLNLDIDLIEPSGWINFNIEEFSVKHDLQNEIINKVLKKLQKLDPVGVFATNLGECLRIQLDEKNKKAKLIRVPKFAEVPFPIVMEPNLVIEYYSR